MKRWTWNVLVAFDKLGNAIANGYPDETISARAATAAAQGKRWGCLLCGWLDRLDKNHCVNAIASDSARAQQTLNDLSKG